MATVRTITCDVPKCECTYTEKTFGDGWSGWGELKGRRDADTGSESFGLCPEHLDKVFEFIGGDD